MDLPMNQDKLKNLIASIPTGLEPGRQDSLCDLGMALQFSKHFPSVLPSC